MDPLAALRAYVVGESSLGEALERVCQATLDVIEPAVMCGISMTVDAKVGTYVFSHPVVPEVDATQYETGDGPCIDSYRLHHPVYVHSTHRPGPYPDFRATAANHGIGSVLSIPMLAGDVAVGGLNLYAEDEEAFDEQDTSVALDVATHAAYLLLNTQSYWDARTLGENLQEAMRSRAEIEQAKGIIMGATGKDAEEAFDELRRQSQHENMKLRDVAREIVRNARRRGGGR